MTSGPENSFRKGLCEAWQGLFREHIYIQKNHGSAYSAGLPDLEICLYGHMSWVELKATKELTFNFRSFTALQLSTLERIYLAGGRAQGLVLWGATNTVTCLDYRVLAALHAQGVRKQSEVHGLDGVLWSSTGLVKTSRAHVWDMLRLPGECPIGESSYTSP